MKASEVRPGVRVVVDGDEGTVIARAPQVRDPLTGKFSGGSRWWVQFAATGKGWAREVDAGHMAPVRRGA